MKAILLLGVAMALASCAGSAKVERPANLSSGGHVSFADLFGIDEERASQELPDSLAQCLRRAYEDFSLALDDTEPQHAKFISAAADGGTSSWEDPCYTLVIFRQLSDICEKGIGLEGAIFGPELRFKPTMIRSEAAAISRTRFVAMQAGKLEGAEYRGCAP
jgi:hypothetical protein